MLFDTRLGLNIIGSQCKFMMQLCYQKKIKKLFIVFKCFNLCLSPSISVLVVLLLLQMIVDKFGLRSRFQSRSHIGNFLHDIHVVTDFGLNLSAVKKFALIFCHNYDLTYTLENVLVNLPATFASKQNCR